MRQRSQIYVKVDGNLEVANYYQWNFGDRMVSRARYGIDWVKSYMEFPFSFRRLSTRFESFRRVWDVNYDYKDLTVSRDLIEEEGEAFFRDKNNLKKAVLGMDNDDGILLVNVDTAAKTISYCFLNSTDMTIMDAKQYMNWDLPGWQKKESSFLEEDARKWCRANIKELGNLASVMTRSELDEFLGLKDSKEG